MSTGDNSHRRQHWSTGVVSFGGKEYPIAAGDTYSAAPVGIGTFLATGQRYVVFWEKGPLQNILQTVLESAYDRTPKNRVVMLELTVPSGVEYVEGNDVQVENKADGQASRLTNDAFSDTIAFFARQGTAALPSHSFSTDTNTGMYSSTADQVHFSAGGTERLEVSSAGITITGTVAGSDGSLAAPEFSFTSDPDTGVYRSAADHLSLSAGGQSITVSEAIVTSGSVHYMGIYPTNTADGTLANGTTGRPYVNLGTYPNTSSGWNSQPFNGITSAYHVMSYDGTDSSPSLYWSTDTGINTGLYRTGEDSIGFTTGGTLRVSMGNGGLYLYTVSVASAVEVNINGSSGLITKVSSSRRYKDNIADLDINTEKVFDLRPVSFNWKSNGESDFGFIAEEVHEILPELVVYNEDNIPEAVKYKQLSILMLEELKTLREEVNNLKEKL
jgi:hypothetical protein